MSVKDFWIFIREKWLKTILLPFVIAIIVILVQMHLQEKEHWTDFLVKNGLSFVIQTILILLFIDYPIFLLDEFSKLSKKTIDSMEKINDFPSLMAFHTEKNVLEEKIKILEKLSENSSKWMYSKFISKLLTTSFEEFTIQFKETRDYSNFSTCIMQECSESVYLTGSMTPYEWLLKLAKNDESRKKFFDNMETELDIQKDNHSLYLRDNRIIRNKKRFVCLSDFNYIHLFLFERSIREYYRVNDGIDTIFINWERLNRQVRDIYYSHMEPLTYEYALYDNILIFKFDKEKKILSLLRDDNNNEFTEIKEFFKNVENKSIFGQGKDELLVSCRNKKTDLLKSMKESNWQLPHKYAYLFHDEWGDFLQVSDKFGEQARNASANLLSHFLSENKLDLNIVEIGPGIGDKIDLVCDRIGTEHILSYTLIDICSDLLNSSFAQLQNRLSFDGARSQNSSKKKLGKINFDCCDSSSMNKYPSIFNNKTVLILNNSTIFTEPNFPWDYLRKATRIIITLDKFEKSEFEEYFKARGLFLSPLKIFGVPIDEKLVNDDKYKELFSDNSDRTSYTNSDPYYKIFFNLKKYLNDKQINSLYQKGKPSASEKALGSDNNERLYAKLQKDFENQEKIVVLSSLKFKKSSDIDTKIKKFFIGKGFDEKDWTIKIKDEDNTSFVGIMITKNVN